MAHHVLDLLQKFKHVEKEISAKDAEIKHLNSLIQDQQNELNQIEEMSRGLKLAAKEHNMRLKMLQLERNFVRVRFECITEEIANAQAEKRKIETQDFAKVESERKEHIQRGMEFVNTRLNESGLELMTAAKKSIQVDGENVIKEKRRELNELKVKFARKQEDEKYLKESESALKNLTDSNNEAKKSLEALKREVVQLRLLEAEKVRAKMSDRGDQEILELQRKLQELQTEPKSGFYKISMNGDSARDEVPQKRFKFKPIPKFHQ